jgi:hypothetical protein
MVGAMWPALSYADWAPTHDTLHMWCQIVGKTKLRLAPYVNHWWEVGFELTGRGLSTGLIPAGDESFQVDFDFAEHCLEVSVSDGGRGTLALGPRSVAEFHDSFQALLGDLGLGPVEISPGPSEVADPVPFREDTHHASYDPEPVERWWHAMLGVERAIQRFRTPFHGKQSPVLFYWGSFDLAHTRFNGRRMDPPPGGDRIMRYAENMENFAIGLWPGDPRHDAALYAYVMPGPEELATASVGPDGARYDEELRLLLLDYDAARRADDPEGAALRFFQSAYEAAAGLRGWDRAALEGDVPPPAPGGPPPAR